ncbi:FGGY-family carbohydrate kinase, partial [Acinetobacter baumannii]
LLLASAGAVSPPARLFDADAPELAAPGDMPGRIAALLGADRPGRAGRPMFARIIVESIAAAFARAVQTAGEVAGREVDVIHLVG